MDGRTLVMGDWHPLMRDPIDVLRATRAIGTTIAAVGGELGAATYLGVSMAGALTARALQLPRAIDLAFVVA